MSGGKDDEVGDRHLVFRAHRNMDCGSVRCSTEDPLRTVRSPHFGWEILPAGRRSGGRHRREVLGSASSQEARIPWRSGTKQGCQFSPLLFNICLGALLTNLQQRLADDPTPSSGSEENANELVDDFISLSFHVVSSPSWGVFNIWWENRYRCMKSRNHPNISGSQLGG
jgi:hypothetical protein